MSASHDVPQPKAEIFNPDKTGNLRMILLSAGGAGILISLIGWAVPGWRTQFAFSWLFAFTYFFTLCAGSLFWILVHHATDAEWSVVVRRVLENVAGLLPIFALYFIPILLCASRLYTWWEIAPGVNELLDKKHAYLNHGRWIGFAVLYFAILSFLALSLKNLSIRQDSDGHPRHTIAIRRITFPGIALFAGSLTFGAFDWLMSLDYTWFSTMWGVYIFAGAAGSAMSMLVLLVTWLRSKGYMEYVTMEHYHIMGKLMLAFCVFWAYIGFSQYMLIWYANVPEETSYFIRRNIGSWNCLSTFLVVGRFFLPFPFLLMQGLKKKPKILCCIAGWMVFMQLVDIYIIVMPMMPVRPENYGFAPHILDIAALLAVGCPLAYVFLNALGKQSLLPVRDPRLNLSVKLTN
jgi:hypothetical protein